MEATLESPASYGFRDHERVRQSGDNLRQRIYYPATGSSGSRATVLPGSYPLVLFAHGHRGQGSGLCPQNPDQDFQRWGGVLHLLARCGMVVTSVDVSQALDPNPAGSERVAGLLEQAWEYLDKRWEHRDIIKRTAERDENGVADHRRIFGVVGHSWGVGGCAEAAASRRLPVGAIASVAGTWESHVPALLDTAQRPTLFIAGTEDLTSAPGGGPYGGLDPPKHEAAVQHAGHWDWFDEDGLQPCNASSTNPCEISYRIAGELLTVFFHRYLLLRTDLPPSLLTMRRILWVWIYHNAGRPDIARAFRRRGPCAVQVRWDVGQRNGWRPPLPPEGTQTLGRWTSNVAF